MNTLIQKKISFNKSYYYFDKDKEIYHSSDCHTNTYIKFYDKNYKEVERREKDFKYVTGLMTYDDGINKYCVVHSWVEDNGQIIDTTSLSNSILNSLENPSEDDIDEIKCLLNDKISYIPYFSLSNQRFTAKCQEIYIKNGLNLKKSLKEIEELLISIVQSVENDTKFLTCVKNEFGYKYKNKGFKIEVK